MGIQHMYDQIVEEASTIMKFNLSAPKNITFCIALIIAVAALLMMVIPSFNVILSPVWWALIAFAILALGNLFKGL
jgi:hypothetical protein